MCELTLACQKEVWSHKNILNLASQQTFYIKSLKHSAFTGYRVFYGIDVGDNTRKRSAVITTNVHFSTFWR